MAKTLSLSTLTELPDGVAVPGYAREDLTPGILHIGVGNFHRAHMAVYLHALFERGQDHDWAIVGAGIKSYDAERRAAMAPQDWLTTVVDLDPGRLSARVTGVMVDFLPVVTAAILSRLADPAIRIVSLTVTEGGYYVDAQTGSFDAAHPDMVADAGQPDAPGSVFGILVAGLAARRAAGQVPFTVMSCDNLPANGDVTRQAVIGLAALSDPTLADWIGDNVAFPNGMVDCITPATAPAVRDMVADRFGVADAAPVTCEPFRQWVLEDHFPAGRPALEAVGVEFVEDVKAHELMKLRILNGGHAAIAYISALLGYEMVHDAMGDADVAAWLRKLAREEIIPTLEPIPGVDYDAYVEKCAERFSNSAVADRIARLCLDGSNRQPKFILPTLADALARNMPIDGLALEVALWCRYCAESREAGGAILLEDERAAELACAAVAAKEDPGAFLALRDVFGELGGNARFADAFALHLRALWENDPRGVLRGWLDA
jgi:mannitol 2-dehydrogenase